MEQRYHIKAHRIRYFCLISCAFLATSTAFGQAFERGEWMNISHTQKLSDKFDILVEHQLRSSNRFEYLSTFLLRVGLNYNFNKHHSVASGYYYSKEWEKTDGEKTSHLDQRIFEQYAYELEVERISTKWGARLEQRFSSDPEEPFSQRLSFQAAIQVPLRADRAFTRGVFAKIEEEVFFNIEHKDLPDEGFYDQSRPYFGLGYRWSKKLDTEFGYMRWHQHQISGDSKTNVMQLRFTTNL
jgi:hypothetical protein